MVAPEILFVSVEILFLLVLSAICSGLNVALMSLDLADLRRKAALNNKDAERVLPLRTNTHLSLAAILLTNTAMISISSIVLEHYMSGVLAVVLSTLLIVVFGEIVPQAYFAKRALWISARLALILRLMIFVTYPVSKPLQLLLDTLFGHHHDAKLQSRDELGILISEHLGHDESELDEDEVDIIRGALSLSEKHVGDIMTPIEKVYHLLPNTLIDEARITEIKEEGWSRVPVINKQKTICYGILLMKDLVDLDVETEPIHIQDLPLHSTNVIGSRTALDTMLRKFIKTGVHLAPVEKDDEIVGIVTIEDLMEEIVGYEIEDETDRRATKNTKEG